MGMDLREVESSQKFMIPSKIARKRPCYRDRDNIYRSPKERIQAGISSGQICTVITLARDSAKLATRMAPGVRELHRLALKNI